MNKELAKQAGLVIEEKEPIECYHDCISDCRREGCNCECGEWHIDDKEERNAPEFIGTSKQWDTYGKLEMESEGIIDNQIKSDKEEKHDKFECEECQENMRD